MTTPTTPETPAPMLPCPDCGDHPEVDYWAKPIPIRFFDYGIACAGCSDYDVPVPAHGATRAEAVDAWNDHCREAQG